MDAIEGRVRTSAKPTPERLREIRVDLLKDLLRVLDSATLGTASGDVFGCIYKYFLMKFAIQGAQDKLQP